MFGVGALVILLPLSFTSEDLWTEAADEGATRSVLADWLSEDDKVQYQDVAVEDHQVEITLSGPAVPDNTDELVTALTDRLGYHPEVTIRLVAVDHHRTRLMAGAPPVAVVLLSGGLDSATVLAAAVADGFECHALSFRYGQRHSVELDAAAVVAEHLGAAKHVVVDLDLSAIGGSALTDDIEVPKHDSVGQLDQGVPVTYVPARNTVFLAVALGMAEVLGSTDIFIGVNAVDYSGYPDCRPEFIDAFVALADVATAASVEGGARMAVHTPLMELSKAEIVELGDTTRGGLLTHRQLL